MLKSFWGSIRSKSVFLVVGDKFILGTFCNACFGGIGSPVADIARYQHMCTQLAATWKKVHSVLRERLKWNGISPFRMDGSFSGYASGNFCTSWTYFVLFILFFIIFLITTKKSASQITMIQTWSYTRRSFQNFLVSFRRSQRNDSFSPRFIFRFVTPPLFFVWASPAQKLGKKYELVFQDFLRSVVCCYYKNVHPWVFFLGEV